MSEKSSSSSRFLLSLTVFSMVFLISSSLFLFNSNSPLTPSPVLKLIVVDKPHVNGKPNANDGARDPLIVVPSPPTAIDALKWEEIPFERPSLNEKTNASWPTDSLVVPSLPSTVVRTTQKAEEILLKPPGSSDKQDNYSMATNAMTSGCGPDKALLRVYMYNLPPQFHFGLLDWDAGPNETWPDVSDFSCVPRYPGGLNLQHSVEYWLTLDLLSSNIKEIVRPCSVVRVHNSSQANFIFVPFFASLSYNRHSKVRRREKYSMNKRLQNRLVDFLFRQPEWNKSKGKDHIIVAHHPNSMLYARKKLGSARFVLADFGRYAAKIANVEKDVIAPYQHVVRSISANSSAPFEQRPTLVYFQGAIHRKDGGSIRHELYYLLKDEKDVHFTSGSAQRRGVREASQGMGSSKFCLNIAGDTPSSNRLFDAITSHCVPVIISDDIELPFEDVLDYSEFSVFVWASDAVKKGFLLNLLRGIKRDEWTKMWERLKEVSHHFEYRYPSLPGDAVHMIWQALSRKRSPIVVGRRDRIYRTPAFFNAK